MFFKKNKIVILLIVLILLLASCNSESTVSPSNTAVVKTPVVIPTASPNESPLPIATETTTNIPSSSPLASQTTPTETPIASTEPLTPTPSATVEPTLATTTTPTITAEPIIKKVEIADYTGLNINDIKIDGIIIEVNEKLNQSVVKGVVISQSVPAGTILDEGQKIVLTISSGQGSLSFGYNLTSTTIPTEYSYGSYTFTINKYDYNVFLRTINGIIVKHQLIFSDCKVMFFDGNDLIYYQKRETGKIYSYSLSQRKDTLLINEQCQYLYYIEGNLFYSTNQKVAQYTISSGNNKTLVNNGASYFQIYGNSVYVLESIDGNSLIKEINISTGTTNNLSTVKVTSFIINDFKVYYYKNNALVYIDLYDYLEYPATSDQKAKLNF